MYIQWVDEDEQDAAPDDDLPGMGGMGGMGGGMPGMEGMGDGGFGGIGKSIPIPTSPTIQSPPLHSSLTPPPPQISQNLAAVPEAQAACPTWAT